MSSSGKGCYGARSPRTGAWRGTSIRRLRSAAVEVETRGYGAQERTVTPILMADREADSLLVCEVLTLGGPLNVMAGPRRQWSVVDDSDHEWRATPSATKGAR